MAARLREGREGAPRLGVHPGDLRPRRAARRQSSGRSERHVFRIVARPCKPTIGPPRSGPTGGSPSCASTRPGSGSRRVCARRSSSPRSRRSRSGCSFEGLATDYFPGENAAGLFCRQLLTAAALGDRRAPRARGTAASKVHRAGGQRRRCSLGADRRRASGRTPASTWASNLLNWLQNASVLMLIGGLRGLATRSRSGWRSSGASLATSRGKHIHVDVLLRYVPPKLALPDGDRRAGSARAARVPRRASCGFVDYIAIAPFQATASRPCPDDASKVVRHARRARSSRSSRKEMSADFFLLGRQLSLDVRSLPHVLAGTPYDHVDDGGRLERLARRRRLGQPLRQGRRRRAEDGHDRPRARRTCRRSRSRGAAASRAACSCASSTSSSPSASRSSRSSSSCASSHRCSRATSVDLDAAARRRRARSAPRSATTAAAKELEA